MKYQFNQTTQLKGYHSLCSEFAKRTCCSGKNFDTLAKKISNKLIGTQKGLSQLCRRRLTSILCSVCDADIGQNNVDGVCPQICQNVFQQCKNDYFSLDSFGNMKVCKQDDIICSKLIDIIPPSKDSWKVCQFMGVKSSKINCWKGIPSSIQKGIPKKKAQYTPIITKEKQNNNFSWFNLLKRYLMRIQKKYLVYLGIVSFLLCLAIYKFFSMKYQNYRRQIKNL